MSNDHSMLERFTGPEGRRRLIDALERQQAVAGDGAVAEAIASEATVFECQPGTAIIRQGASDNPIYFIVAGSFSIVVNGRDVARRQAGQHVGEMALIDPAAPRSASVIARETSVVAKLSEDMFSRIANQHPRLWRLLAVELCARLRERNALVRPRNEIPVFFIVSSVESLAVAREVQAGLSHDKVLVELWTDRVFGPSKHSIEALEAKVLQADFAAIVLAPDDEIISRGAEAVAPRDNVVFELGFFMGPLTHNRTFMILPRGIDLKIPTDLLGLTPLTYEPRPPEHLASRIGPVCTELRHMITRLGPR